MNVTPQRPKPGPHRSGLSASVHHPHCVDPGHRRHGQGLTLNHAPPRQHQAHLPCDQSFANPRFHRTRGHANIHVQGCVLRTVIGETAAKPQMLRQARDIHRRLCRSH